MKRPQLPTRQAWEKYHTLEIMSTPKQAFFDIAADEIAALAALDLIGPATWAKVRQNFPSLQSFLSVPPSTLSGILNPSQQTALRERQTAIAIPKGIKLILLGDRDYPELLREINDPPLWLFIAGNHRSLTGKTLAVVGSRKHSSYAGAAIEQLLPDPIAKKIIIISGLAYGIDKMAHQRSLAAGGVTVAVLAGGLDKIYPSGHEQLARQIVASGGALVSEYPPGSPALPFKFPVRNRIIAGLSRATVVVEAAVKSGTMSTARSAIDYNRELFVVPGDITRKTSEGCNYLIAQGAAPLITPVQLRHFFNIKTKRPRRHLDQSSGELVDLLSREGRRIDQIVADTGQSIEAVLQKLTELELAGTVYQIRPGVYQTKKNHG
ncbi:MAG: DNA-processing protein DprA [Patescibacteria group bacterium]